MASLKWVGVITLTKANFPDLNNVNNTSDLSKPVSTATRSALGLKANLISPALTGAPTAPTVSAGDSTTKIATTAFVMKTSFTHYVGELFGGGIVVYVYKNAGVEHGLIASLADLSAIKIWSNVNATLIGATSQSTSNGQTNTTAIIGQALHTNSAAKLCDDYTSGGFTDWYLPSKSELYILYSQYYVVNTILESDGDGATSGFIDFFYWSSTENNVNDAWYQDFRNGSQAIFDKSFLNIVRAVRVF